MSDLLLVFAIIGCSILAFIAWRTQQLVWGREVLETGWINRAAHAWHRHLVRQKQRRLAVPQDASPTSRAVEADASAGSLEDRLENEFRRYRANEISLDDYKASVQAERDVIRAEIAAVRARPAKGAAARELKEMDLEEAQDALDATRWRLQWIQDRKLDQQDRHHRDEEWEFIPDDEDE